jgi:predicted dithiol-disulfide oxidoreductase (DUF899 family)
MPTITIPHPPIVSRDLWLAERKKLLAHEKELTQHYDRINAERRRLPMVKLEKSYEFDGPQGSGLSKPFSTAPTTDRLSLHVRSGVGQGLLRLHGIC